MFMAHLDVTPEAPAQDIKPIIHYDYDGGDIKLPAGIVLSPNSPQGMHLKNCIGKTIITSDGSTLLGADDKAGVTVLVGLIEMIISNKNIEHGDLYFVFSQNEDIGRAADRFEEKYVDGNPDIIIDVDGNMPDKFSVENFTASMLNYHFIGHDTHPGDGFVNKYGDALTAASYFIGQIDPKKHPSASKDKQGYIHCYSMTHPTDSMGKELVEDYLVKVRLRYFDKNEGDTLRQMLKNAEILTAKAYPFVKIEAGHETMQYENIAYTMYPGTAEIITKSAEKYGLKMSPCSERGGTTSAMMAALVRASLTDFKMLSTSRRFLFLKVTKMVTATRSLKVAEPYMRFCALSLSVACCIQRRYSGVNIIRGFLPIITTIMRWFELGGMSASVKMRDMFAP